MADFPGVKVLLDAKLTEPQAVGIWNQIVLIGGPKRSAKEVYECLCRSSTAEVRSLVKRVGLAAVERVVESYRSRNGRRAS